jgi:hypothetical protein
LEGSRNHNPAKTSQRPKFPPTLKSDQLLVHYGQTSLKTDIEKIQRHTDEINLLNVSQFGLCTHHNITLQCVRLAGYITLNFNNNMSTAEVFLEIEKAFDTKRQ